MQYSAEQIAAARDDALDWLTGNGTGCPRSWAQIAKDDARRGYVIYDDEAPPIAGYDALEREGVVERDGLVSVRGEERVRFRLLIMAS